MLTIKTSQLSKLSDAFVLNRNKRILSSIKKEYPQLLENIPEEDRLRVIDIALEDGSALKIVDETNLTRFALIAFWDKKILLDTSLQSALLRTRNRIEVSPEKRLDFIYKHIFTV